VYRTCAAAHAAGYTQDGDYWIGFPDNPFLLYCFGMLGATPVEYLDLQLTSNDTTYNYSTYVAGPVHGNWTCPCGTIVADYGKIRLDPDTLVVNVSDTRFASFTAGTNRVCLDTTPGCPETPPPYAVAQACVTNYDAAGRANVNLTGTAFHIPPGYTFETNEQYSSSLGYTSAGTATIDATRKVVDITGGGDCGGFGGWALQLYPDNGPPPPP
jgi:hypothetical protein